MVANFVIHRGLIISFNQFIFSLIFYYNAVALYNGMLRPLIGYTMKGAIWYQGEDNVNRAGNYADLFSTMIKGWRKDWNQGDFPFYYCQIAPYNYDLIQWDYKRVHPKPVQLNDIVVFNYPSGDTVLANPYYQAADFYSLCYSYGKQIVAQNNGALPQMDSLTTLQQRQLFSIYYQVGRQYVDENYGEFGGVMWRPADRRENYVKRCVGLPGQTLEIKDHIIYLDGKPNKEPDNVQYNYRVVLRDDRPEDNLPEALTRELGLSDEDLITLHQTGHIPLTSAARERLLEATDYVEDVIYENSAVKGEVYPLNAYTGWTRDNYGPVWIPKKGESIDLTLENLPVYERPIRVYEGNELEVTDDGKILINGKEATSYTFKMDYYWMMGDNRHNSADSRYWGFVPEDHIVGKPIMIWLSIDKDRSWFDGHIRWKRLFRWVDNIK